MGRVIPPDGATHIQREQCWLLSEASYVKWFHYDDAKAFKLLCQAAELIPDTEEGEEDSGEEDNDFRTYTDRQSEERPTYRLGVA